MKFRNLSSLLMIFALSFFMFSCEGDIAETDAEIIQNISTKWTVGETGGAEYDVTISAGTGTNEIKIANFNDYGPSVYAIATVSGLSITIKPQILDNEDVVGTGTIASDYTSISLSYSYDDGTGVKNVTASLSKYIAAKQGEKQNVQ